MDVSDIAGKREPVPKLRRDPLNPVYQIESPSRRIVKDYGRIDGSSPVSKTLPKTRRRINQIMDIAGSSPKDRGSIPAVAKLKLQGSESS